MMNWWLSPKRWRRDLTPFLWLCPFHHLTSKVAVFISSSLKNAVDQKWERLGSGHLISSLILWPYLPGWEAGKCNITVWLERRGNSFGDQCMCIYPHVKHYQTDHVLGHERNPNQHKRRENHTICIHYLQHNPSRHSQQKLVPIPKSLYKNSLK